MASDFYKKTKDLFEEYQKRELQYLNARTASQSQFPSINNMPVQKYLETLNKREKENEEAYLELMSHMEQLDQRTESITSKLQKLETLRMAMGSKTPVWPYSSNTYDRSFQDYTSSANVIKTDNMINDTVLHTNQSLLTKQKVLEYASTQTDIMFCENCQFPLTVSSLRFQESLSPNDPANKVAPSFQSPSLFPQVVENEVVSEITVPFNDNMHNNENNLNLIKEKNKEKLSVITQSLSKIPEETPVQKNVLYDKYQSISTDIPLPIQNKSFENEIKTTGLSTANENIPIITDHKENVVDERINNQFKTGASITIDNKENVPDVILNEKVNVLNSDKKESNSNLHSTVVSETVANSEKNKFSDLNVDIVVDDLSTLSITQNNSQLESEGEITISKNNLKESVLKQDVQSDKGSESPISIAEAPSPSPYSETASALSDSDSFDGKEGLKVSAAYQALLGNVSVTKKTQKTITYSESESEDEVERALANATRKSSSVATTVIVQEEKPDDSHTNDSTEPKAKSEPRKSISLSKSQQLSKSTRKVLGLDTSSGSEGEIRMPVKTSKKVEEDSDDEFFYD